MKRGRCLYINFCTNSSHVADYYRQIISSLCRIQLESRVSTLFQTIRQFNPDFLIFEYDFPDQERLAVLQQTKATFHSLPILMLTEYHSEDLAIWAFRSGVHDYLYSPVAAEELFSRIGSLIQLTAAPAHAKQENLSSSEPVTTQLFPKKQYDYLKTAPALNYIRTHLHEKITLSEAAQRCELSPYAFSRLFHKEHKVSFQEFLLRARTRKAQGLLSTSLLSITEISYEVGFGDLSYFVRIFHRYNGVTPTQYRLTEKKLGAVPMCILYESRFTVQQPPATISATACQVCENTDCPNYPDIRPVKSKRKLSIA